MSDFRLKTLDRRAGDYEIKSVGIDRIASLPKPTNSLVKRHRSMLLLSYSLDLLLAQRR
jgi:hypothetical protein